MTLVAVPTPAFPPSSGVLRPRRTSRRLQVGDVSVGGGAPVSVQTMSTTVTADVDATLQQIAAVMAAGCDIVRVAVPSQDDADALAPIVERSPIPVIADIHFQPRYIFAAIDAGCAAVRVNPGNIRRFDDQVRRIAEVAGAAGVPIRIGVNAGSLDARLLAKHGGPTPEALAESALWECSLFEEHGFTDLKIAVKHHDPLVMIQSNRILARSCDYPLHLGVTEAGPAFQGRSSPPSRWESFSRRGSATPSKKVEAAFDGFPHPLRVAVMGCVVNGPGESREADLGVSSGNGKGQILVRG